MDELMDYLFERDNAPIRPTIGLTPEARAWLSPSRSSSGRTEVLGSDSRSSMNSAKGFSSYNWFTLSNALVILWAYCMIAVFVGFGLVGVSAVVIRRLRPR